MRARGQGRGEFARKRHAVDREGAAERRVARIAVEGAVGFHVRQLFAGAAAGRREEGAEFEAGHREAREIEAAVAIEGHAPGGGEGGAEHGDRQVRQRRFLERTHRAARHLGSPYAPVDEARQRREIEHAVGIAQNAAPVQVEARNGAVVGDRA